MSGKPNPEGVKELMQACRDFAWTGEREAQVMTCKHCAKEIEDLDVNSLSLRYRHADGYYNCDGRRGHSETYAEPKIAEQATKGGI